jgi:hypothetical protein
VRRTTRRAFLRNAAIAAAALHARPSLAAAPAGGPEKLISLGGPTALSPGSVHDYRYWGNGADVLATGTRWVKLWVAWSQLQGSYVRPSTMAESWGQLNAGVPGTEGHGLRVLDEQVAAANADGVKVLLCLQHDAPEWANRLPGDPQLLPPPRHNVTQRLPRETGPDSPFGWFVAHMCARYRRPAPANLSGPRVPGPGELVLPGIDAGWGNPSGAFADAIEIGNEPNLMGWPLDEAPRIAAEMLMTADEWSARLRGPAILGPATSDTDGRPGLRINYLDFTRAVLRELTGWRPRGQVAWSHHNYGDMADGNTERLGQVRSALEAAGWHDRAIWLTEGGYDTTPHGKPQTVVTDPERAKQARVIRDGYRQAAAFSAAAAREGRVGVLPTFAQHVIHDQDAPTNTFKSGLRDDFRFDPPAPGARRPAWFAWRSL